MSTAWGFRTLGAGAAAAAAVWLTPLPASADPGDTNARKTWDVVWLTHDEVEQRCTVVAYVRRAASVDGGSALIEGHDPEPYCQGWHHSITFEYLDGGGTRRWAYGRGYGPDVSIDVPDVADIEEVTFHSTFECYPDQPRCEDFNSIRPK